MKRGPNVVAEDLVVRSYAYGEVKGSITLAPSTPLDIVGNSIIKRFCQNPLYFRTELKDGVYIVSEKEVPTPAVPAAVTFSEWKYIMQPQYPTYLFSALNSVETIPPIALSPIIVPNIIYSHRFDNGRYYYALPQQYRPIRPGIKFMERATEILDGYNGIASVSMVIGISEEECGYSPASFVFKEGAVLAMGAAGGVGSMVFTESSDFTQSFGVVSNPAASPPDSTLIQKVYNVLNDFDDHSAVLNIIKQYQPSFDILNDDLNIALLPVEALISIDTHFVKIRNDLKSRIISRCGKRKLNTLMKQLKIVNFETIDCATFQKLEAVVAATAPKKKKAVAPPPVRHQSHEELKKVADQTVVNTNEALWTLQDELKRMAGRVVERDHIVNVASEDYGACYRAPL